ncbi:MULTISPECIES: phage integrase N-terminal SAM-like domain-containing protein [Serratia]|uniref:phage integrase N-terminal SAM-like domain-containing protein n=1 Tax=Serratia TaxID=613 RepID=UPI000B6217E2|nr:hypothetical protein BVG95_06200 [Serratia marcescens]
MTSSIYSTITTEKQCWCQSWHREPPTAWTGLDSDAFTSLHIRTEKSYLYWIRNFIRFHQLRYPQELGSVEVNAFLTRLAA